MIPNTTMDSAKSILKAGTYPMVSGRPHATYDQLSEILTQAGYPISYIKVRRECLKFKLPTTLFGRVAIVDAEMALDSIAQKPYKDGHLKRIDALRKEKLQQSINPENPVVPHTPEADVIHNPRDLQFLEL